VSDGRAFKIFFVSLARSLGIPAWMDDVTGKIRCMKPGAASGEAEVLDIDFDQLQTTKSPVGRLILNYEPVGGIADPKYYTAFSISKFQDGAFRILGYDEGDVDMGGGVGWSNRFKNGVELDTGYYMLTSGVRQSDGSVLTRLAFFNIEEQKTTGVDLILRENNKNKAEIIGRLNSDTSFLPLDRKDAVSLADYANRQPGRYYVIAILGPGQEPTNHALRDIAALGRDFEESGQLFLFLFRDKAQSSKYRASDFPGLPGTITYGVDENGAILKQLVESLAPADETLLPVVVVANALGEVVFKSRGYTIGLGEQLAKTIESLK
jgi:hypothetical protein